MPELRAALSRAISLHYAIKAYPMPALVQHMAGLFGGLDVASAGEMQVALNGGMPAQDISFAGSGKRDEELAQAVAAGVLLNCDSPREAHALARVSERLGWPARVAVRVNPDFELKSSGMKMSGGPKQFGVDAEAVPELLREIGTLGLAFERFHLYVGSQNLRAAAIAEVAARRLPQAELIVELGRYLVGEADLYVCRVIDRKVSRGHTFLITDGGLHHDLAASGNFGQVLRKNYPVAIGNRIARPTGDAVSRVGPQCTPLDLLGERMALADAQPGDLVMVYQSGAYGATASPQGFLGHPAVAEVLV